MRTLTTKCDKKSIVRIITLAAMLVVIAGAVFSVLPSASAASSTSPKIQHVIWILMENRDCSQVIGNTAAAPYQNQLAAKYAVPMKYYGVTHPSLPNYIAITSGSTFGLKSDLIVSQVPRWIQNENNIVDLIRAKGLSWKVYAESMPYPYGMQVNSANGLYVPRHNPLVYYHDITNNYGTGSVSQYALSHIVPFTLTGFQNDLKAGKLANYTFIVPNMLDDAHSSSTLTGDRFLQKLVPTIQASKFWVSTVVFIVYDEGCTNTGFTMSNGVAINGGKTVCIVVSPYAKTGYKSYVQYSHYSLLATTEKTLRLGSLGRNDAVAKVMSDLFTIPLGS